MGLTLILNPPLVAHIHVMDVLALKVLISLIVTWVLETLKKSGSRRPRVVEFFVMRSFDQLKKPVNLGIMRSFIL